MCVSICIAQKLNETPKHKYINDIELNSKIVGLIRSAHTSYIKLFSFLYPNNIKQY